VHTIAGLAVRMLSRFESDPTQTSPLPSQSRDSSRNQQRDKRKMQKTTDEGIAEPGRQELRERNSTARFGIAQHALCIAQLRIASRNTIRSIRTVRAPSHHLASPFLELIHMFTLGQLESFTKTHFTIHTNNNFIWLDIASCVRTMRPLFQ
jgi:hypothetical protein